MEKSKIREYDHPSLEKWKYQCRKQFNQLKETKQNKENISNCSSFCESTTELECTNNELTEFSLTDEYISSINIDNRENDEEEEKSICSNKDVLDNSFYLFKSSSILSRRIHQTCERSTQTSLGYVLRDPLSTTVVRRRRRAIESIYIHVQQKKNIFKKLTDLLYWTKPSMIYELGLQFLYVYDGIFNYKEGHTFVMFFRKKIWYLTIEKIKYVECQLGEHGSKLTLIFNYKNQLTSVHV
ncbi:unnamed protein product [Rotaria sordida]|uniref:Uncharacterized protein n=1 Tax=Rotaria sordida TaxID=392033 RepID=A0A819IZD4_9BILA|nr:unnamed protein product [Rotaria sordida]CAF1268598.1 unnamed protein product [Rotaria sordida]CAF1330101.1 unnamed protein product [Rotaria sordida]CAF3819892.1 unnamed protein product [Rotaria sordida]CAF3925197.1 unnamed protein product [Rotaria sordida]